MKTGFSIHLAGGICFGLLLSILLLLSNFSPSFTISSFILFVLGSVLPDIDCPVSKPRRYFRAAMFIGSLILIAILHPHLSSLVSSRFPTLLPYLPLLMLTAPFLLLGLMEMTMPKHRGALHSPSSPLLYALLLFLLLTHLLSLPLISSILLALFSGLGYSTHLLIDAFGDRI